MTWTFVKGGLMMVPIFIIMGIIGNLVGAIALGIFTKSKSENINSFLKLTIYLSYFVGAVFFLLMGMFYASFTLLITCYMAKWLAIILVSIFLLIINKYTFKEVRLLHNKNILLGPYEFYEKEKYYKQSHVVNENVLLGGMLIFPAYIFFLIFNGLADKLSFGFNSYLIWLVS
jgi:hypothetical protein